MCVHCYEEGNMNPYWRHTIDARKCDACSESIPAGGKVCTWLNGASRAIVCVQCAKDAGLDAKADRHEERRAWLSAPPVQS